MAVVYQILSPSGKRYIGSALSPRARWNGHRGWLRRNGHHCRPLQNAANKYGVDALRFEVIAECPAAYVRQLEQTAIEWFDPEYNSTRSVSHADTLSELWRNPEFRARNTARAAALAKQVWSDPKFRAAAAVRVACMNTPEVKAKAVAGRNKRLANDPEFRSKAAATSAANFKKLHADPDFRKALIERQRIALAARCKDPEFCARRDAAIAEVLKKPIRNLDTGEVYPSIGDAAKALGLNPITVRKKARAAGVNVGAPRRPIRLEFVNV